MNEDKKYIDSVHRIGRIGSLIAVGFMLGIPTVICIVYRCFPHPGTIIQSGAGLLALMLPIDFAEIIGYAPILGSSSYITFITGNVMSLKLPVVISAQQIAGVEANTQEADAVSTMAVSLSSIETTIIIALGVVLLKPLAPVLTQPVFRTAIQYIVPALIGALVIGVFGRESSDKYIKNKSLVAIAPAFLSVLALLFIPDMQSYQGIAILISIPVAIGWAYMLHKKGLITMVDVSADSVSGSSC